MPESARLFAGRPKSHQVYEALRTRIAGLGAFEEQVKTTSIHLARRSAFAGVHPRKNGILLVIRTAAPIENGRIRTSERVSANRWHSELLVATTGEVDDELVGWLATAYKLSGT